MTALTRAERLRAVRDMHEEWVNRTLPSVPFRPPDGLPDKSVFNQHYVDLEADGTAQDEFHAAAMNILQPGGRAAVTVTVRPLVRDVVRELLGRKFNPLQPRDGDGKWSKDKLNLAGKMDLENGEEVAASGSFKTMGASAVMAKTSYPEYPGLESLYVGIVAPEDERKWRGHALGSTAVLDRGEVAELRKNLDGLAEKVSGEESKMIDEWDAIQEFGGHEDGADLTPEQNAQVDAFYQRYGGDRIDSGVLVEDISGSALVYNIFGAEGDDGDLQLLTAVAIRPDGEGDDWYPGRWDNAMVFEDWPEVKAFGRQLDKVDGGTDARLLSAGVVRKFDPSQPRDDERSRAVEDAAEIAASWFEPNERHPGHPDQSSHGNWAKNAAKKAMGGKDDGGEKKAPAKRPTQAKTVHGRPRRPEEDKPDSKKTAGDWEVLMSDAEDDANKYQATKAKQYGSDDPTDWDEESQQTYAQKVAKADRLEAKFKAAKAKQPRPRKPRSFDDDVFEAGDGLNYCRGYAERAAAQAGNPGDPIDFTASTPGVKRDGLDLRGNGWRLDNFHRSPVFQWCHDKTMPPLGRVDAKAGDTLQARVFFDQEDDLARRVESKYRRGFLHAVSVGWDFVDGHGTRLNTGRLSLDEIRDRAFYDLTELSGVPVPADPDALIARQRSGLRTLGRQLVSIFDEQEHGTALAEEVARALEDELERLGLSVPLIQQAARHLPARKAGFFMPKPTGPADTGISQDAARNLLAAFTLQGAK